MTLAWLGKAVAILHLLDSDKVLESSIHGPLAFVLDSNDFPSFPGLQEMGELCLE